MCIALQQILTHWGREKNGRHFADDIFKRIFLNENIWIPVKISLKFVPKGSIYNIPALVQIMAWRRPGDKSLSEPMMVNLQTHICVTRPQWVNSLRLEDMNHNWFRYWLVAYSTPNNYLNQWWLIVNWTIYRNKSWLYLNRNSNILIE